MLEHLARVVGRLCSLRGARLCVAATVLTAASARAAEPCTDGCHEDVANTFPGHQTLGCAKCHPNVPDGQVEHAGVLDETPTDKLCAFAGCHEAVTKKTLEGKHKDAPCEACHGDVHGDFATFIKKSCRQCHKEELAAFDGSAHAAPPKGGKEPVTCASCHGDMHDVKLHGDPRSPMSKVLQVSACGECHGGAPVERFRKSAHGRALLKAGLTVAPTCSDCHGAHDIRPTKDDASTLSPKRTPETCGVCHGIMLERWKESAHGRLWARGDTEAPVCTSCHPGHHGTELRLRENHLEVVKTCERCHEAQSRSYRDSFHGKATRLGYEVAATCSDCHSPHEMLGKDDPRSTVHASNLVATCARCHPGATASFAQFMPHEEPSDPKSDPRVHWVWLFMTTLLVGTLGFFGVHTLLWFQRAVVAFRRGEFGHAERDDVWIRRFRPVHVWIHFTIVVTFLSLAATGLPIKFSGEPWAAVAGALFGGLGASRWVHRVAGVLTFAYAAFFVGYLFREIVLKKRRELLWGWQSMVPSLRDLTDLRDNLRWFLYLGPKPKLDRWAYWEKFDFFAVFWGVPVIGLSGLMLWAPIAVTKLVPGWVLNIAYLVHSDEALLATGFIFFFHLFHTHLRPEAFPLDPVIFLGAMPLERFKAERPAEYERLVADGTLDAYRVPAPSAAKLAWVRRFGFTALTVGVVLGAALFAAFVRSL